MARNSKDQYGDELSERLKYCGCGLPESALELTRDVLATIDARWSVGDHSDGAFAKYRARMKELLPSDGIEYVVLYHLDSVDMIEHGGGVGGSWLTREGRDMLCDLNAWAAMPDGDDE
jgi:hypothetical protein